MSAKSQLLPQEVTTLIHHVELNRAGWWEKTIQRLVLAAIWMADKPQTPEDVQKALTEVFKLSLGQAKVSSIIDALISQGNLVRMPEASFRIPDKVKEEFQLELKKTHDVGNAAKAYFAELLGAFEIPGDPNQVWEIFEINCLVPLIKEVGANTYRLISGERLSVDKKLLEGFTSKFAPELKEILGDLVIAFIDPQKDAVRAFVTQMLHARFCVEASGLPPDVIAKLNQTSGSNIRFRVFVDTNFLFSLLALHENPSNTAASELLGLISQLKSNPKVELFVTPPTIAEALTAISAAKFALKNVPGGGNFTGAALNYGFSGMVQRFLLERQSRGGKLTAEEWFDPYLSDFVTIARNKGVEIFNEKLDAYSMRSDVLDDINFVMKLEERRPNNKRKSYEKIRHDMVLWHFVKDKRAAYVSSPLDAHEWLLTVDFGLILFDEHRHKRTESAVPLCLHPTSLIQLLQFWVPRNKEFEEAVLGSLRFPFLFQDFDVDGDRTSLAILNGLGRFDGRDDLPQETIANVLMNDGLRARLKTEHSVDEETKLIRDALVEEMKNHADAEAKEAERLRGSVAQKERELEELVRSQDETKRSIKELESSLNNKINLDALEAARLKSDLAAKEAEIQRLANEKDAHVASIAGLQSQITARETHDSEAKANRRVLIQYFIALTFLVLVSCATGWLTEMLLPGFSRLTGKWQTRVLGLVLAFIAGHLMLEFFLRNNVRMLLLWPFVQMKRFRAWLLSIVILGFVFSVVANLYSDKIEKRMEENSSAPVAPANIPVSPQTNGAPGK